MVVKIQPELESGFQPMFPFRASHVWATHSQLRIVGGRQGGVLQVCGAAAPGLKMLKRLSSYRQGSEGLGNRRYGPVLLSLRAGGVRGGWGSFYPLAGFGAGTNVDKSVPWIRAFQVTEAFCRYVWMEVVLKLLAVALVAAS